MIVVRRPARTVLTALGTTLGVGAVVATLGIVETTNQQVSSKFNALQATEITVEDQAPGSAGAAFPTGSEARLDALHGVTGAGLVWTVSQSDTVSTGLISSVSQSATVPLVAATPAALRVMHTKLATGRLYDSGDESRGDKVILLGEGAAEQLGIKSVDNQSAVFIDGVGFTVIGIIASLDREPQALLGAVIPTATVPAVTAPGTTPISEEMLINTQLGAAQLIGQQAPYAINPTNPSRLSAIVPPDPSTLRLQVEGATSTLLLLLAALALGIGMIAIANTTLVAVLERVPEIGVRRAMGARPIHIAVSTLLEAAVTGLIGGIIGASLGILVTGVVAIARQWTAVMDVRIAMVAPLLGCVAGVLAGAYPAWRATQIQPIAALQR